MIGLLKGVARDLGGTWVIEVNGTGWRVIPTTPLVNGEITELIVTTVVKEDSISLYGFSHQDEQRIFESLLRVSGVGANTALNILKELGVAGIISAVRTNNAARLSSVKGVGKNTATKIVTFVKLPNITSVNDLSAQQLSALEVLSALGYQQRDAYDAVSSSTATSESEIVKEALTIIGSINVKAVVQ
ncbi:MAG: Holliday junction branch migration protein RuvA [Candidatus Paceibacterota bacterium]